MADLSDLRGDRVAVVQGDRDDTMVPQLRGAAGLRQIAKMERTDDTIGAMLWAIETTLAQVNWIHEPRDAGRPSRAPEAVEAADFANSLLQDMEHSFQDHVEEAITMIPYGFSVSEALFKRRTADQSRFSDDAWGIEALAHIGQASVTGWGAGATGATQSVKHVDDVGQSHDVPLYKCLHYTIRGSRRRPQGRTLFSNVHRSWWLKNDIQDSEAIGIRRELAGLPKASVPKVDMDNALRARIKGDAASMEEKAALERVTSMLRAATKMRFNETAGLVVPSDPFQDAQGAISTVKQYDFEIMTSAGQRTVDTNSAIGRYDRAIARVAMMQFLHLGDRSTGSYNLSENQSSLALKSMRALVGKIRGEWQRKILVLVWELNGRDKRWLPEMLTSPITEDSLEEVGKFLDRLSSSMDLLNQEPNLKESMFSRVGVKPNTDVEAQVPQDRPQPVADPLDHAEE